MLLPLEGKRIVLGVTGSVAAYKAVMAASRLTQLGAEVVTVLTEGATHFVTPLSFQAVTGQPAYTDADLWGQRAHVLHVGLGQQANLVLIAPATANTLAKLAHGQADNLLTLTALSTSAPIVVAPAMDGGMFTHPATQANLKALRQRGVVVLGPAEGRLASGLMGPGRMVEPDTLVGAARYHLTRRGPWQGKRVVVTAGGTQEPIDPVRAITNRSTGRQGFALAQAALDCGAEVTLIAGSTTLPTPWGARRVDVRTAAEMAEAVFAALEDAEALFMAAAVADYRPLQTAAHKIKKGKDALDLHLTRTMDILAEVHARRGDFPALRLVVGFAAESRNLLSNARAKLQGKGLDMVAANDITARDAGFGAPTNRVTLLYADGGAESLPLMEKEEVARHILARALVLMQGGMIGHLCSASAWEAAQQQGEYRPPSLEQQGFIHFSRLDQLPAVAQRWFPGRDDLVLLLVPMTRLISRLRWEAAGGVLYPHMYAPLAVDAVIEARKYRL